MRAPSYGFGFAFRSTSLSSVRMLSVLMFPASMLAACEKEAPPVPAEPVPTIGALELPISQWNTGAARGMEITLVNDAIFAGGSKVVELSRGQVAPALRTVRGLPDLATALEAAERPSLTINAHGTVGFGTLARVIETASQRGFTEFQISVRTSSAMPATRGYLPLSHPLIVVGANADLPFAEPRRSFREVNDAWQAMFDACRGARYIDCDQVPAERAKDDGSFYVALFSRGSAMQIHFRRFGVPAPTEAAAAPQAAVPDRARNAQTQELAVGQTDDQSHPLDMLQLNVDGATFSMRAEVAAQPDNGITHTTRTLCGARRCDLVLEGDEETPLLRIVTLLGAAFPNGAQVPRIAVRVPS